MCSQICFNYWKNSFLKSEGDFCKRNKKNIHVHFTSPMTPGPVCGLLHCRPWTAALIPGFSSSFPPESDHSKSAVVGAQLLHCCPIFKKRGLVMTERLNRCTIALTQSSKKSNTNWETLVIIMNVNQGTTWHTNFWPPTVMYWRIRNN